MSDRRKHLLLLGFIAAALAGVALLAIPGSPAHKKATLGLDLQGGLEVVLKAVPERGQKLDPDAINRSITIMRNRIDKLGVSEPEIRKQGSNQIVIQLAGVHDPEAAAKLIGKTAVLEFYDFEADLTGPSVNGINKVPVGMPSLYALLSAPQTRALADKGEPSQWYLFDADKKVVAGPVPTEDKLPTLAEAEKRQERKIKGPLEKLRVPKNTVVVSCDVSAGNCLSGQQLNSPTAFYLLKHRQPDAKGDNGIPEMTGRELKLSGTRADIDPQSSQPVVLMQFTGKGKKVFHDITRARGAARCRRVRRAARRQRRCSAARSTSRSCSTARSSRSRTSTSSVTRTASRATTAPRSKWAAGASARRRISRSCSRRVRCR